MKSYKKLALAGLFLFAGFVVPTVQAATCSIYFSNSGVYSIAAGATSYPLSWTQNCSPGTISGTFTNLSAQTNLSYRLEKQSNGTWTQVASGSYIRYSSTTGNYRFVVVNASNGNNGNYTFDYRRP